MQPTIDLSAEAFESVFIRRTPVWKRGMDILGSLAALILLSPLMLIVALIIKIGSPGPIFYIQPRGGQGGKPFAMCKFRSMYVDADRKKRELMKYNERSGPVFKMTNDPRITPVGRFIRKWSIDELPQLLNVLKGDMSLVGPRPLPVEEDSGISRWHTIRRSVKPGITCLWQISKRDESSFDEWVRLDIRYVRNFSLWQDMKILFGTIPAVLSRRGAK